MRRAALVAAVCVLVAGLGVDRVARADPWKLTMEAGGEGDTNVKRVDNAAENAAERISAAVASAGARVENKDRLLGGGYVLSLAGLARMLPTTSVPEENVLFTAGDGRWLHPLDDQPLALGVGVTAADSWGVSGKTGARTFRNLGADGVVALGAEDRRLTLAVGARQFKYKDGKNLNWRGPSATARLDVLLWQETNGTRNLDLTSVLGFEARGYLGTALAAGCSPYVLPTDDKCFAPTSLVRRDRFQRAEVQLDWTGDVAITGGYQLTVIDSNSYGQSLIRHRITARATAELFDKLYGTITGTLQIDQYPDGLLVETSVQRQDFMSLEDENRSSLQFRIARELSPAWSIEARGAIWRDIGVAGDAAFHRELIYAGIVYSR